MQRRIWKISVKLGVLPSHHGPTYLTSMLEMPLPQERIKRERPVIIAQVIGAASSYSFQSAYAGVRQLSAFSEPLPCRHQPPVCELCCGVTGTARGSHRKSSSLRGCTRRQEPDTDSHALDTCNPLRVRPAIVPLAVCFGDL